MHEFSAMSPKEIAAMLEQDIQHLTFEKRAAANLASLRAQARQRQGLLPTVIQAINQREKLQTSPGGENKSVEAEDLHYLEIALGNFEHALDKARSEPGSNPDLAINQLVRHLSRLKDEARAKAIQEADQRYADSLFHEFWEQVKIGKGEGELSIYQIAKLKQDARLNSASIPYPQSQNPESDHVRGDDHTVAAQPRETSGVNTDKVLEIVSTAESFAGPISEALQEVLKDALTGL